MTWSQNQETFYHCELAWRRNGKKTVQSLQNFLLDVNTDRLNMHVIFSNAIEIDKIFFFWNVGKLSAGYGYQPVQTILLLIKIFLD